MTMRVFSSTMMLYLAVTLCLLTASCTAQSTDCLRVGFRGTCRSDPLCKWIKRNAGRGPWCRFISPPVIPADQKVCKDVISRQECNSPQFSCCKWTRARSRSGPFCFAKSPPEGDSVVCSTQVVTGNAWYQPSLQNYGALHTQVEAQQLCESLGGVLPSPKTTAEFTSLTAFATAVLPRNLNGKYWVDSAQTPSVKANNLCNGAPSGGACLEGTTKQGGQSGRACFNDLACDLTRRVICFIPRDSIPLLEFGKIVNLGKYWLF